MTEVPIKHEHRLVPPDRKLKELRCWAEDCAPNAPRNRMLALYDAETQTLFLRCRCGSWQPVELASL